MTEQMTTGPCIALEIRQENAVKAFRDLVGPMDPEIAKNLRPNTLRARFGTDRIRNANTHVPLQPFYDLSKDKERLAKK